MASKYLISKVDEAWRRAKGQPSRAQALLVQWARDDHRLMVALCAPYIAGIAAQALKRHPRGAAIGRPRAKPLARGGQAVDLDAVLAVLADRFAADTQPGAGAGLASLRHQNALRTLSRATLAKRFDNFASSRAQ